MDLQEFVLQEKINVYHQNSSKDIKFFRKMIFWIFRQKKVVELLEKNFRIHCSVHNKVIEKRKFFEQNSSISSLDCTE
jgi:hypothetical protein